MQSTIYYERIETYLMLSIWCLVFILLGASLNFIVMEQNGGRMPVKSNFYGAISEKHLAFQENDQVEFYFLGDIIDLRFMQVSIGDLIIICFIIALLNFSFRYRKTKKALINHMKSMENKN